MIKYFKHFATVSNLEMIVTNEWKHRASWVNINPKLSLKNQLVKSRAHDSSQPKN